MKITSYNQQEAIEMLLGRVLLFFMGEYDSPLDELGEHGEALWEMCSGMSTEDAAAAIKAFKVAQWELQMANAFRDLGRALDSFADDLSDIPPFKRGIVWCKSCGKSQRVDAIRAAMGGGWPKCCGYAMTIDSPGERAKHST